MPVDLLVLSRYDRLGASSRVRTYQYLRHLLDAGVTVDIRPLFDDAYVAARNSKAGTPPVAAIMQAYWRRIRAILARHDARAIWIEYEALPWLPYGFERWLYHSGRPVIVDYDDAVFHRYDLHPRTSVRRLLGAKIDRVMAAATVVVAGNEYLAGHARKARARRIEILPSVIDLGHYRQKANYESSRFVVGWIGSRSTSAYLPTIEPALRNLSTRLPLQVVTVGGAPWTPSGIDVRNVSWNEASEVDEILRFDVGVMPLPDEPWTRGKCGYKLLQYMGCALPAVASPVGVNRAIVGHGKTGFLASSTEDWRAALEALATSVALRRDMGREGYAKVQLDYSLAATAPRLVALVQSILQEESR